MTLHARLDGGGSTFILAAQPSATPQLLYYGAALPADISASELEITVRRFRQESTPDDMRRGGVFPTGAAGEGCEPALRALRPDGDGVVMFGHVELETHDSAITARMTDERRCVTATLTYEMCRDTGVLRCRSEILNNGYAPLGVDQLMAVYLPLPAWATMIAAFSGDWSREGHLHRFPAPPGQWASVNRSGRTGFSGSSFAVSSADPGGETLFFHLAWSGDHRLIVETLPGGDRIACAGAGLAPGEVTLGPGERLVSPDAYVCYAPDGMNGVSDRLHPFIRKSILPPTHKPRKIHFNTWEAVYFDFDESRLVALAESAAALGVERFVLDDGWFAGRSGDHAALGDWRADPRRFANGLSPVISRIRDLGMDFGLWIEPEMVSPDSDLHRSRPDWCVHDGGAMRPLMRRQLWLDLSRREVRDHLVGVISALLSQNDIAYLKWDCNRTIFPAVQSGRPGSSDIIRGSYEVMERVRAAHPRVDIESCASGGARIDLAVMRFASRVWPSDNTDPVERLRIQSAASVLLPLETIGSHIGADVIPVTGRSYPADFRARVAMFGHMGLEADPTRLSQAEREALRLHFAEYRHWRALIHSGRLIRAERDDGVIVQTVIRADHGEALTLAASVRQSASPVSAPVRIGGLMPQARYRVRLVRPWSRIAGARLTNPEQWESGILLSGAVLAEAGLHLPLGDPMTAWLIAIARET
jgi:alpha-galactosidase